MQLSQVLTTSGRPGNLMAFSVMTLAAMWGRLCFMCHTRPLFRFTAALLPGGYFGQKPAYGTSAQLTAGRKLAFLFHHVAGSATNAG